MKPLAFPFQTALVSDYHSQIAEIADEIRGIYQQIGAYGQPLPATHHHDVQQHLQRLPDLHQRFVEASQNRDLHLQDLATITEIELLIQDGPFCISPVKISRRPQNDGAQSVFSLGQLLQLYFVFLI